MIFELAEHVKAFLHSHNKPGIESFYEEMLKRQRQQEEFEREAKQKEKDLEVYFFNYICLFLRNSFVEASDNKRTAAEGGDFKERRNEIKERTQQTQFGILQ